MVKYFAWKDRAREALEVAGGSPHGHLPHVILVNAYFSPPKSWSRKKRSERLGGPHEQKPDLDNVIKAVADSLFPEDKTIAVMAGSKYWDDDARVEVVIFYK